MMEKEQEEQDFFAQTNEKNEINEDDLHDEYVENAVFCLEEDFKKWVEEKAEQKGYYKNSKEKIKSHIKSYLESETR